MSKYLLVVESPKCPSLRETKNQSLHWRLDVASVMPRADRWQLRLPEGDFTEMDSTRLGYWYMYKYMRIGYRSPRIKGYTILYEVQGMGG